MSTDAGAALPLGGDALTALADPMRQAILELLRSGQLSVQQLADRLPVSRPAVSHHLNVLQTAKLVTHERIGTRRIYRLDPAGIGQARAYLDEFWRHALTDLKALAEESSSQGDGMTQTTPTIGVTQQVEIRAPREEVFVLLTERPRLNQWWPNVPTFEPRIGGRFEMALGGWHAEGEITELEPPRLVAFTWRYRAHPPGVDPGDSVTEVRFELEERGAGTLVTLTHSGFLTEDTRLRHDGGWAYHMNRLRQLAEGEELGPDEWIAGSIA